MANQFINPEVVAATALGILERELVSARLVTRLGVEDFRGAKGDTVTVRVPAVLEARDYEWRTRTAAIVVDDVEESEVPVTLDKHPYHAAAITDEDLTLSIEDFGRQVLRPQMAAVARKIDGYVDALIASAPLDDTLSVVTDTDPWRAALKARKALNVAGVPMADRFLYLGADDEVEFLDHDKFVKVNEAGTDSALRDAIVGKIAGFTCVTGMGLPADESFAFHRSAFALGNVAPAVPEGATAGATAEFEGFALRWVRDYDPNYLRDRSVVSSFAGVASVNEGIGTVGTVDDEPYNKRVVRIDLT